MPSLTPRPSRTRTDRPVLRKLTREGGRGAYFGSRVIGSVHRHRSGGHGGPPQRLTSLNILNVRGRGRCGQVLSVVSLIAPSPPPRPRVRRAG